MIAAGKDYMRSFNYEYLFASVMFGLTGLFIGSGHTTFTLFSSVLSSVLIRIPMAYFGGMVLKWGMFGIGLAGPASSMISLLLCFWFYKSGKWEKRVILHDKEGEMGS